MTTLRRGLAAEGSQGYWRAWRDIREPSGHPAVLGQEPVAARDIASILTHVGEREEAIDWLERAFGERDSWLVYLNVEPAFDGLRGEVRFQDLLKKIGIPKTPDLG